MRKGLSGVPIHTLVRHPACMYAPMRAGYTKTRRTQKKDKTWSLHPHSCTSHTHAPIDQWSVLAAPLILAERNVNVIFFPFLRPFFGAEFYIQGNVSEKFSLLLWHMKKMTKKLPGLIACSPASWSPDWRALSPGWRFEEGFLQSGQRHPR